ncbi:hypothetical protein CCE01nite_40680 [Cellulomonas cellasea]|uniref:Uncharacterized protein n=1 Tax=Cellulomonas cellasea TaxID=43670 RepID=A0A4Y3L0F8_9CELL|nr:hypothetical protein CCE01nite_40680 [Cellulomonas cellasea]
MVVDPWLGGGVGVLRARDDRSVRNPLARIRGAADMSDAREPGHLNGARRDVRVYVLGGAGSTVGA